MKLTVLSNENFTCNATGMCCRKWYPELLPSEIGKIEALSWPADDSLAKVERKIITHRGKSYLARAEDGACLFLNQSNGLCRIHEQFGFAAKPLNCQAFPFQIKPTFKGEATVIGRFDCPTVRRNAGASHRESMPDIRRWAGQIDLSGSFDEALCCNLEREQIEAVSDFVVTMMPGFARDEERALFIAYLSDVLAQTAVQEVDRAALATIYPRLKQLVHAAAEAPAHRPGMVARIAFRTLLGLYLRRDEDVLSGLTGRFGRVTALSSVVLGGGNFHSLGLEHPAGKLRKAGLFKPIPQPPAPGAFSLLWRMVHIRLSSFQFMGLGNNNRDFLNGLRSLALLFPLVKAVAKYHAGNRGAGRIEAEDVDPAVTAIEHSFGRLPVLNRPATRSMERLLLKNTVFTQLVQTV